MDIGFTSDISSFTNFTGKMYDAVSAGMANEHIGNGFDHAQIMYLAEQRERFMRNSHSGGNEDWLDIKPITKLKRLKAAGGKVSSKTNVANLPFPILYITGSIYTSLYPGGADNVFRRTEDSVQAGTAEKKASFQHRGGWTTIEGNLVYVPPRPVIWNPSEELLSRMVQPIVAGFRSLIQEITGVSVSPEGSSLGRAA